MAKRKVDFAVPFLLFFIFLQKFCKADNCKSVSQQEVFTCCPKEHRSICCAGVPTCGDELELGSPQPPCSTCENDVTCESGFYKNRSRNVEPCPNGFYCPKNLRCIIPCSSGGYCRQLYLSVESYPQNSTGNYLNRRCEDEDGTTSNEKPRNITGMLLCPGAGTDTLCGNGHYCPNTKKRVICPSDKQCYDGSIEPMRCNILSSSCNFFAARDIPHWISLISLSIILLALVSALVLFVQKRDLRLCTATRGLKRIGMALQNVALMDIRHLKVCQFRATTNKLDLKFYAVTIEARNKRRLLSNVSGKFKSGEVTAIMGPSGCGKTTLLKCLLGIDVPGKLEGDISINNIGMENLTAYKHYIGYVQQHDIMYSLLTVKETLTYQAMLHLPSTYCRENIRKTVDGITNLLRINSIADHLVGSDEIHGISGGQRRRVSIGMALVRNPSILFLDEPTSGLDSSTSLSLIKLLRTLAEDFNMTVVTIIHQPRYELFETCHKILLLGCNGRVVYTGETRNVKSYFESLTYEFPTEKNVADVIIDITSGTHINDTYNVHSLPELWENHTPNNIKSRKYSSLSHISDDSNSLSFIKQMFICCHREIYLQMRAFRGFAKEIFTLLAIGLIIGSLQADTNVLKAVADGSLISLGLGLIVSISSLRQFVNKAIYRMEFYCGLNRFSFFFAVIIVSTPIILLVYPVTFFALLYVFSNLRGDYWKHLLNIVSATFAVSGISYNISIVNSEKTNSLVAVGFVLISSMFSGSFTSLCDLKSQNVLFEIAYTLSYSRWFVEAYNEVEMEQYSDIFKLSKLYRAHKNGYSLSNYWNCIGILFVFGFVTRLTALLLMVITTAR